MDYVFKLLSLWWTFPAVAVSTLLLFRYGPRALSTIKDLSKGKFKDVSPSCWINLGISICFFGSVVDNAYWLMPWSLSYVNGGGTALFDFGVYINAPFRQVPLIIGSILHVLAEAMKHTDEVCRNQRLQTLWRTFWISGVAGAAYVVILTVIRIM